MDTFDLTRSLTLDSDPDHSGIESTKCILEGLRHGVKFKMDGPFRIVKAIRYFFTWEGTELWDENKHLKMNDDLQLIYNLQQEKIGGFRSSFNLCPSEAIFL